MKKPAATVPWKDAADPDLARDRLAQLQRDPDAAAWWAAAPDLSRQALVRVLGASPSLGEQLLQHPGWLPQCFGTDSLEHGRRAEGLRRESRESLDRALAVADHAGALTALRTLRQREHVRIAARDLGRLAPMEVLTRELSDVADVTLAGVYRVVRAQLASSLGEPWHLDENGDWCPTAFSVLGLGKLGGQELNFSSDVDVLFVYSAEGSVFREPPAARSEAPEKALPNHRFFIRLAEAFIAEVGRNTPEGRLYRIDLRLRPEGDAGPLARSLDSYENFYAQWGQTWERLMLLKARPVAGDRTLGAEFLDTVQPFRYPRSLHPHIVAEIPATKRRMETEAIHGDLERDVKRGRGGIREIEFVVQSLQLVHGGRQPFLQGPSTLPALRKLEGYGLVSSQECTTLTRAYHFLRDIEHRLQMENDQQTHTLPADGRGRERIARLMGFPTVAGFDEAKRDHTEAVRAIYEKFLPGAGSVGVGESPPGWPGEFDEPGARWEQLLTRHGFREAERGIRLLREFVHGPGWAHVSARTEELARRLVPDFLKRCLPPAHSRPEAAEGLPTSRKGAAGRKRRAPSAGAVVPASAGVAGSAGSTPDPMRGAFLSDPDRVLARLSSFIAAYGARAPLYETWTSHPQFFDLLLWLFDRSEHLAELAIRAPDLVEDLVLSGRLRRVKTRDETLAELRHGSGDADQGLWMRKYHAAEELRLGLRSILGLASWQVTGAEITALAEACLHYAGEQLHRRFRMRPGSMGILGLGKLGGAELSFGSDLDVLFVTRETARPAARLQDFASALMELLSARTEAGSVFECDPRLRPDGEKGVLVQTPRSLEDYYRKRAQLWEIQALTRARPVAGDPGLGREVLDRFRHLTDFSRGNPGVAAWTPEWPQEIERMRHRIERERTPAGKDDLALKTGRGGLVTAEFLAQALCLRHGYYCPQTLPALEHAVRSGWMETEAGGRLVQGFRELRSVECILRRWSYESEDLLPDEPAPYRRVAIRCGFREPGAFTEELRRAREAIHDAASAVFHSQLRHHGGGPSFVQP